MKKIIKKLILIMGFFFVGSFFIQNNITFAENAGAKINQSGKATDSKTADTNLGLYQTLGRSLYTVTWPLIVIAGQFMDNQVVYGSFIGMDTLLWKIWNVMRTFANYIIGLILIFSIFTLFLGGKLEQFNPIKIIPQLVISAVLVNASWFLIGACIDVSNILTYSLGTLPMKIAGNKIKDFNTQTIPTFGISLQNGKGALQIGIYDQKLNKILPFCKIKTLVGDGGGIEYTAVTTTGSCVAVENMKYYKIKGKIKLKKNQKLSSKETPIHGRTFSEIEKKLGGMTGILGTLYSSITNLGNDVNYQPGSSTSMTMGLILKLLFLLALVIPLFTLAVLLIVRVVILWMFIIISPIVFLFTSVKSFEKFLGEKGKLSELCCMVFMPVIVVFALSVSFVFLTSLKNMKIASEFGISGKGTTAYISIDNNPKDNIKLNFKLGKGDSAANGLFLQLGEILSWIIRSIFSIGFMWVIVFAALKSCKITRGIASSIQNFSQTIAKSAPVIPTGIAGGQSISSLKAGLEKLDNLPSKKQQSQFNNGIGEIIKEYDRNVSGTGDAEYIAKTNKTIKRDFNNVGDLKTYSEDTAFNASDSNSFINKYGSKKISDLIGTDGKAKPLLSAVAASLGVTAKQLKNKLEKVTDKNTPLSSIIGNVNGVFDIELGDYADKPISHIINDDAVLSFIANSLKVHKEVLKSRLKAVKDKSKKLGSPDGIKAIKEVKALSKLKDVLTNNVLNGNITLLQLDDDTKKQIIKIFDNNGYSGIKIGQNEKLAKALKGMGFSDNDIIKLLAKNITGTGIDGVSSEDKNTIKGLLN